MGIARWVRARVGRFRYSFLVAVLLVFSGPGPVSATTGATTPTPARYKVALNLAQPFRGQYSLQHPASSRRLISGSLAIDLNQIDYLFGITELYSYDSKGSRTTILVGLYNFHLAAHNRMLATVYNSTDTVTLGSMSVTQNANGDLVGQIRLGRQIYAVHWHKNHSL
jgi:hypothetical protein